MQTVLEKMQGYAETVQAEFVSQTEFFEAKEVFAEVFGKVTTDELLASIVEGTDTVCTCVVTKGWSLLKCKR